MSDLSISGIAFKGVAAAVPKSKQDNAELKSLDEKSRKEIIERVGIRYRHIANDYTTAADLCQISAEKLLNQLSWNAEDVGILVFVTQTPDYTVPGTASQLQHKLGLHENAICIDVNQGCAGYVYGMSVLCGMMKSFNISKGLLLVGDTITKLVSENDNSIWPIFSDAGSATAFELDASVGETQFRLGSKGVDFEAIHIPSGGFRKPLTEFSMQQIEVSKGVVRAENQLSMNGQAVFTFGLSTVASEIKELLKKSETTASDFDFLVLHQANQFLNDAIARKVGFEKEKVPSSLYDFGNTSCTTIPVTLVSQLQKQLAEKPLKLLLCGFGVGLSWGSVILDTDKVVCPELIYV